MRVIALRHKMSDYLKVKGYNSLVRDTNTHAIINKDKNAYNLGNEMRNSKTKR